MRPGDAFQADIARNRVQRRPKADGAVSLHTVVGLILMPWCHGTVPGTLDEYVVVEEARGGRSHQASRGFGRRRFIDKCAKFRDTLPVAKVLEERCRPKI